MDLHKIYRKMTDAKWFLMAMAAVAGTLALTGDTNQNKDPIEELAPTTEPIDPPVIEEPQNLPTYLRELTDGEKKMLHSLLGSSVNLNEIKIWSYHEITDDVYPEDWPENDSMIIMQNEFYSEDYSRSGTTEQFEFFIRHAVLLGQSRMGMAWPENSDMQDEARYTYMLEDGKRYSEYDRYQQAAIISDYAGRFIHPAHGGAGVCKNDNALADMVEREFNSAARYRNMLPPPRPMELFTPEEINLANAIFGDEIDVSQIQKHFSNRECDDAHAEYFENNRIVFYGAQRYEENYARASNAGNWGLFIHELTHIWQAQNELNAAEDTTQNSQYSYVLEDNKRLEEYTTEQQGNIIRDYAYMYLQPISKRYAYAQDGNLLRTVVEDRLPQASKSRQHIELTGALPNEQFTRPVQPYHRSQGR